MPTEEEILAYRVTLESQEAADNAGKLRQKVEELRPAFLAAMGEGEKNTKLVAEAMKIATNQAIVPLTEAIKETKKEMTALGAKIRDTNKARMEAGTGEGEESHARAVTRLSAEYEQLKQRVAAYKAEIDRTRGAINVLGDQTKRAFTESQTPMSQFSVMISKMSASIGLAGGAMGFLAGMMMGFVFKAINAVKQAIQESIQALGDYIQALTKLQIVVKAYQREGGFGGFAEITETLRALSEYKVFSAADLMQGYSLLVNIGRQVGLTLDEMNELSQAIAKFAVLTGASFEEASRAVATFMRTGRTETLGKLEFAIGSVRVETEAVRRGFIEAGDELSRYQRAQVGAAIIMDEAAKIEEDYADVLKELPGLLRELEAAEGNLAIARAKAFEESISTWTRIRIAWKGWWTEYFVLRNKQVELSKLMTEAVEELRASGWEEPIGFRLLPVDVQSVALYGAILELNTERAKELVAEMQKIEKMTKEEYILYIQAEDVPESARKAGEDAGFAFSEGFLDALTDLEESLVRQIESYESSKAQYGRDYERTLERIKRDFAQKRKELYEEYEFGVPTDEREEEKKIDDKYAQRLAKMQEQYDLDVLQAMRNFANRRKSIEDKYREREITAEINFQDTLRRLREGYLLSLEDAVRARDAAQIKRLTRRYTLQVSQAARQAEIDKAERARAHQLTLDALASQQAERLQVLREEMALRVKYLQQQALEEKRARAQAFADELQDLRDQEERRNAEAKIAHDNRLKDLDIKFMERLQPALRKIYAAITTHGDNIALASEEVIDILASYFGETGQGEDTILYWLSLFGIESGVGKGSSKSLTDVAKAILDHGFDLDSNSRIVMSILEGYFGPGGYGEGIINYWYALLAGLAKSIDSLPTEIPDVPDEDEQETAYPDVLTDEYSYPKDYEEYTTPAIPISPGLLQEIALSLGTQLPEGGAGMPQVTVMPASLEGRLEIDVTLSPDLQGRIVEDSLQEISKLLVSAERTQT